MTSSVTAEHEEDARALWRAIADRFAVCKLVLHPEKTRIVYCKDVNWSGDHPVSTAVGIQATAAEQKQASSSSVEAAREARFSIAP